MRRVLREPGVPQRRPGTRIQTRSPPPQHVHHNKIRFTQIIGGLAKIEGSARTHADAIHLELAMTESIKGPVKGVLKRSLPYSDLEDVEYIRRFLKAPILKFTAASLGTLDSVPGATGFEYAVTPHGSKAQIRAFVADARLAIAEATTDRFTRQIEQSKAAE